MGTRNAMPNDVALEPIWKVVKTGADEPPYEIGELSRKVRFFIWLGVIMAQADTPRGWGWNPSVITLCIVIGSLLTGGGWYIGHLDAQIDFLKQQQVVTQQMANVAKDRADYSIKESDKGSGHRAANTNANTEEKK